MRDKKMTSRATTWVAFNGGHILLPNDLKPIYPITE